jgi:putative FmdB family regulatory protein
VGWIIKDIKCNECGLVFEEMYKREEEELIECPTCSSTDTAPDGISSPALGLYSIADAEGKRNILMERSAKHTMKEVVKNADRFGDAGLARRDEYLGK